MYYLGIDLGGTNIAIGLVDANLKIVLKDKKDKSVVYVIEGTNDSYKFQKGNGWVKSTRKDYGYYPVFILGDANVAKFIKARRYSFNESTSNL